MTASLRKKISEGGVEKTSWIMMLDRGIGTFGLPARLRLGDIYKRMGTHYNRDGYTEFVTECPRATDANIRLEVYVPLGVSASAVGLTEGGGQTKCGFPFGENLSGRAFQVVGYPTAL